RYDFCIGAICRCAARDGKRRGSVGVEDRVLVLMPTAKDAEKTRLMLGGGGLDCAICNDISELCQEMRAGAGAALLTEEGLAGDEDGCIPGALKDQPKWSDFPFIVLAREKPGEHHEQLRETMNVTLVEQPVKVRSLLSVVRAALRARRHQYAVRN